MALNFFGLNIGSTTIKAVQIAKSGNKRKLLACGMISSAEKGLLSEMEPAEIAVYVKSLLKDVKIGTKLVNTSLSEARIFTRMIEIPLISEAELNSAMKWEAEQYVPLPLSEVTLDWQILSKPQKIEDKMTVLLVAVPNNVINKQLKILELSGLEPVCLETEITAIARILIWNYPDAPTTLLVNLGALSTDLIILRKNIIVFTHSISSGGIALARAVAQDLGFEVEQAEEYKKVYGLEKNKLEGKIFKAIAPVFNLIINEIKRSIEFYRQKDPENSIKRLVLSGGTAKLPGLAVYLAKIFGLEVQIINPWQNIEREEKLFPNIEEDAPFYTAAVGLALKDI